jgi:hypothetical protein
MIAEIECFRTHIGPRFSSDVTWSMDGIKFAVFSQ